jgi:hypothetical protein
MLTRTPRPRRQEDVEPLDPQEALVCTMVMMAAADGIGISDREIGVMSALVQTLPIFQGFDTDQLQAATETAVVLLRDEEGLAAMGELVRSALEPRLRETAYGLACEVVAASREHSENSLRMLELVMLELELDPLVAAAIERGTRARYQPLQRG